MSFPLYYLLAPYGLFIAVWLVFNLIAFFHMFKYGCRNLTTFLAAFIYLVITVAMAAGTWYFLSPIDWSAEVNFFDPGQSPGFIYQ